LHFQVNSSTIARCSEKGKQELDAAYEMFINLKGYGRG
jgi:hypothetical protein